MRRAQKLSKTKKKAKLSEAALSEGRLWEQLIPTEASALIIAFLRLVFSYCVHLRVKHASAACKLRLWSAHLVRERLICAECQSDAMSKSDRCGGDGIQSNR